MSITSFRLAREAQALKEKEEVAAPVEQEACQMPEKVAEPEAEVTEKPAATTTATMKPKTKTATQK